MEAAGYKWEYKRREGPFMLWLPTGSVAVGFDFLVVRTMISQTVEYALRAIVTIAQHEGEPCTAQQISSLTQVPAPYLSKLMQGVVRAGLVSSQRGLHGGFTLSKRPEELTIWEVVEAVEPIRRVRECPLDASLHGTALCPLHRRLDNAMATVEEQFCGTTIADILAESDSTSALCLEERPSETTDQETTDQEKSTIEKSTIEI